MKTKNENEKNRAVVAACDGDFFVMACKGLASENLFQEVGAEELTNLISTEIDEDEHRDGIWICDYDVKYDGETDDASIDCFEDLEVRAPTAQELLIIQVGDWDTLLNLWDDLPGMREHYAKLEEEEVKLGEEEGAVQPYRKPEVRREKKRCLDCLACRTEMMGWACDGAMDDGCFICTPGKHQRPPCPPDALNPRMAKQWASLKRCAECSWSEHTPGGGANPSCTFDSKNANARHR